MAQENDAAKTLKAMKVASETVRSAIAAAIPVAPQQVLTVSIPGAVINHEEFAWNIAENIRPPLSVRVAEARLVDGMIPLSKFTAGKTGKSVARSYLSTLDLLVPVETSVSGAVAAAPENIVDEQLKTVASRYKTAMDYLKSADDAPGANGRSKLQTYVEKQEKWSQMVESYSAAQDRAIAAFKPPPNPTKEQIKEAKESYMQWLQEHGRDYKHAIQARYMDWVVHGYKFMIDFNFGIVDISSGMKRIENSKEAFRNLVIIAEDGVSEYSSVILSPSHWATIVQKKVEGWRSRNSKPNASEIRSELRRLKNLKISHEVLRDGIVSETFFPAITAADASGDSKLKEAYAEVYAAMDDENADRRTGAATNPKATTDTKEAWLQTYDSSVKKEQINTTKDNALTKLISTNEAWVNSSLSKTSATVRQSQKEAGSSALTWIDSRTKMIDAQIEELNATLKSIGAAEAGAAMPLQVINEKGITITDEDLKAAPESVGRTVPEEADAWTRVSCKVSASSDEKESESQSQASAVSVSASWGLWSVSGGASHSTSSSKAMSKMSNLDVEIKMDCMVVEIDRPWLNAELFTDAELDSGMFEISPGEEALKKMYEEEKTPNGRYQQFSSFPTAFIVAADIELSFSGDTTSLESAVSASQTEANVSVGYGPFSVSASHKQSKNKSKTKMESTATGCKISVQAPQIIGWVQTLMPQLPKPKDAPSKMAGQF